MTINCNSTLFIYFVTLFSYLVLVYFTENLEELLPLLTIQYLTKTSHLSYRRIGRLVDRVGSSCRGRTGRHERGQRRARCGRGRGRGRRRGPQRRESRGRYGRRCQRCRRQSRAPTGVGVSRSPTPFTIGADILCTVIQVFLKEMFTVQAILSNLFRAELI